MQVGSQTYQLNLLNWMVAVNLIGIIVPTFSPGTQLPSRPRPRLKIGHQLSKVSILVRMTALKLVSFM
jgi:hypothetical protein